jgi:hypothetical protein
MERRPRSAGIIALVVYGISIYLANWMIRSVGTVVLPDGSHLLPVGFGLMAPSGTYAAGITFVARDVVQRTIGRRWSLLIITPGAILTALLDVRLASHPHPRSCSASRSTFWSIPRSSGVDSCAPSSPLASSRRSLIACFSCQSPASRLWLRSPASCSASSGSCSSLRLSPRSCAPGSGRQRPSQSASRLRPRAEPRANP